MFKIKDGYKQELQRPKTMKLFGSTKKLIDKTKNRENVPILEVVKVVLIQCNLVHNQCQGKYKVLYDFTLNKSYAYLLNVKPSNSVFFKSCNTEFDEIVITFTHKNCRPLEIKDKIDFILLINK